MLFGGKIEAYRIFTAHGGWIRWSGVSQNDSLWPFYGGIVISVMVGFFWLALYLWKREGLVGYVLLSLGLSALGSEFLYLAHSTHHGYGDGILLYEHLGQWKKTFCYVMAFLMGLLLAFGGPPFLRLSEGWFVKIGSKPVFVFKTLMTFALALACFFALRRWEPATAGPDFHDRMRPLS